MRPSSALLGSPALLLVFYVQLAFSARALAENSPEEAESRARHDFLPKIEVSCGTAPAIEYDGASLREHNPDIQHQQTSGNLECNEPLRYLWYACQTAAGKAAVSAAHVERVVCKGTSARVGSLTLDHGTLTVERATEEQSPYKRSRKRFEALLHVSLRFGKTNSSPDPYHDDAWTEVANAPTPTLSNTDYCLVNGQKQAYDARLVNRMGNADGKLQCWKFTELIVDLTFKGGHKTGFVIELTPRGRRYAAYRDDKKDGEHKSIVDGRVTTAAKYDNGTELWTKTFDEQGHLTNYWRKFPQGSAGFNRLSDGKIYSLHCRPQALGDEFLRPLCGFDGPKSTPIYDGTERVNHIDTWEDGVLRRRAAGDSAYAVRSTVEYVAGEKHGVERVLAADGTQSSTIMWKHGVKDGEELGYANGGRRVVKAIIWKLGERQHVTEYFLNGNPKREEWYDRPDHRRVRTFWDTGKVALQGEDVNCARKNEPRWCQDGVWRLYFEDGTPKAETQYKRGEQHGPSKTWWDNGKQATSEEFVTGHVVRSRRWNEGGALIVDEEYEADGSTKLRR